MPLLSVIIPTHNRAKYAIPTIRSVLAASIEIEVVVSDTSEIDMIASEFAGCPDLHRLVFVNPSRPASVVENFNAALAAASGDYLVFIGDDDFVSAQIIEVAEWAKQQQVDAIKFSMPVQYYWPDFEHYRMGNTYGGTLHIAPFTGSIVPHDAKKALRAAIDNLGGGVLEMPRAYAGMISRSLAEKICTRYKALFGGVSPDIYSSALISKESERCVKIDFPVIVPGGSGASTAGQSANGKHVGDLRDNDHIGAFKSLKWDERIPEFYSVPTVWSYSLLKAIELINFDVSKVNFPRLYAKCLIYQRSFKRFTIKSLRTYVCLHGWWRTVIGIFVACMQEAIWVFGKLWGRLKVRYFPASTHIKKGLADTQEASKFLEFYLADIKGTLYFGSKNTK